MVGCKSNQQKAGMAESNAKPTVTVTAGFSVLEAFPESACF